MRFAGVQNAPRRGPTCVVKTGVQKEFRILFWGVLAGREGYVDGS